MKAAQISTYGDPSVIQISDVDKPVLQDGQILVEVRAASLNPFDSKVRAGYMKDTIPLHLPITLGGDIAGTVVEIGSEVTMLTIGDRVYGQASAVSGASGAFAEFAVTSATSIAKAPHNTTFTEAAALPLVGVSALQALEKHIGLQPGQKIFIHGGAGGIGSIAIQIAKNIGAYIATTATGDATKIVRQLGADEIIDYKTNDFTEMLSNYDAVFDTVGGDDFTKSLAILKKGGVAVSMAAQADAAIVNERDVIAITQFTKVTPDMLDRLRVLVEGDVITPQVTKVFPLSQAKEAFEARESGTVQGKVVIEIQ